MTHWHRSQSAYPGRPDRKIATSLRRPTTHRCRSAAECSRRLVIHSKHDYVQWEHISTSARPATIQVAWAYHTSGRAICN